MIINPCPENQVSSRQMAAFRQEAPYRTLTVSTSAWQRPVSELMILGESKHHGEKTTETNQNNVKVLEFHHTNWLVSVALNPQEIGI